MMIKGQPQRRCIGCMKSFDKNQLIRIACSENGVSADPCGRIPGRGVYVCRNRECLEKAIKKNAVSRGLRTELTKEAAGRLRDEIMQLVDCR